MEYSEQSIKIVEFDIQHLRDINLQDKQKYIRDYFDAEEYYGLDGLTLLIDNVVIYSGGLVRMHDTRYIGWSLFSADSGRYIYRILRLIQQYFKAYNGCRIEATCCYDFEAGHRLLTMLGFSQEAKRMIKYEIDGTDSSLYAKIINES